MKNFQGTFETRKPSFINDFKICMIVPLNFDIFIIIFFFGFFIFIYLILVFIYLIFHYGSCWRP